MTVNVIQKREQWVELTERTWLTADRDRAVPDGHADAAFLLGNAGLLIPVAEAVGFGMVEIVRGKAQPVPDVIPGDARLADLTLAALIRLADINGMDRPKRPRKKAMLGLLGQHREDQLERAKAAEAAKAVLAEQEADEAASGE